jgi:EmrB/QacA subfamily drug resistance transporter
MSRSLPLILAVALFMENMDSTVISTALPAIATDIGTSPVALKLALTSYLVSLAIFIPVSSWMADRFGAKQVFRIAIVIFLLGSIACAAANSLEAFVAARFLQGMGGAMMTPVGRLLLVRSTPKSDLVNAMAWLTIPGLLGPMAGPPVGGFLTTYFSWHWIFLINLPIGIAGILLAGRFLPEIEPGERRAMDWRGFLLAGTAAAGVIFGLSVISLPALPPIAGTAALATGIAAAIAYLSHARRSTNPLLDPWIFSVPSFRAAISALTLFRIGTGATPFLLPLLFQLSFGMTPFQSGMTTFIGAGGAIIMKFSAKPILGRFGFRTTLTFAAIAAGIIIAASSLFTDATPHAVLLGVLLAGGLTRSLFFTGSNALVFADLDNARAGQATAIVSVAQQVSVALGVALAGITLELSSLFTGDTLTRMDFAIAFIVVGLVTFSSALVLFRLPEGVGAEISGERRQSA